MTTTSPLHEFIRDAARAGKCHAEMRKVLGQAGWNDTQVNDALKAYYDTSFPAAVPMPQPQVSMRFSALNIFFFVVMYLTIWAGISIAFTFLDYHLPDGLGRMRGWYFSPSPLADTLRGYIATAVVCAPLAWLANYRIQRMLAAGRMMVVRVRERLIYMTLVLAALITLGNLIFTVYYFLSGELGMRFLIKVAILGVVSFATYLYFSPENRRNEETA